MKRAKILEVLVVFVLVGCSTNRATSPEVHENPELEQSSSLEKPQAQKVGISGDISAFADTSEITIQHRFLTIIFDPKTKNPKVVTYALKAGDLTQRFIERDINPFAPDPFLKEFYPELAVKHSDYTNSKYDRGHMAPAEDFTWNEDAFFLSYSMANMIPQVGVVNGGSWARLEEQVRSWACGEKQVTIVSGPIYGLEPKRLKADVAVPTHFFKIVIDETPPRKVAGFIYSQSDTKKKPTDQVVSVNDIQRAAGADVVAYVSSLRGLSMDKKGELKAWHSADCKSLLPKKNASEIKKSRQSK